jgi:hypothetical protein
MPCIAEYPNSCEGVQFVEKKRIGKVFKPRRYRHASDILYLVLHETFTSVFSSEYKLLFLGMG